MDPSPTEVIRLLRLAQSGQPERALAQADERLGQGHSLGILYARAVALHCLGDHIGATSAAELMLALTAARPTGDATSGGGGSGMPYGTTSHNNHSGRVDTAGWRSVALSFRACEQMILSEIDPQAVDLESTLHDLAQAEAVLGMDVTDEFVLATAHTGIGHGYQDLRLYELARPHYEAAFDAAITGSSEVAVETAVTSQLNLAEMHLNWSVELHRIRDDIGAREKSAIAAGHAVRAHWYATTEKTQTFAPIAALLGACAESSGEDHELAVHKIQEGLRAVDGRGRREDRAFALPFLAQALDLAGRREEALNVAGQACDALPEDAGWLLASAAYHTRATLLAKSGSASARAGLAYGDQLAGTMWRQRLRTLQFARSMQFLERVTLERDRVQILAHTDALTGIGNRRAFDAFVQELNHPRSEAFGREIAVIVADVDGLKEVNDVGGHEAGDLALKAVAGAFVTQVRPEDLVARIGGDEFVVVVVGMARDDAASLATRMVDSVANALGSTVSVSVGVATGPPEDVSSYVLRAADEAMYAAKRARGAATIV